MHISIMSFLKQICSFISTLKLIKICGLCDMKVMTYEVAFQITLTFPRANAWNASQDIFSPFEIQM